MISGEDGAVLRRAETFAFCYYKLLWRWDIQATKGPAKSWSSSEGDSVYVILMFELYKFLLVEVSIFFCISLIKDANETSARCFVVFLVYVVNYGCVFHVDDFIYNVHAMIKYADDYWKWADEWGQKHVKAHLRINYRVRIHLKKMAILIFWYIAIANIKTYKGYTIRK